MGTNPGAGERSVFQLNCGRQQLSAGRWVCDSPLGFIDRASVIETLFGERPLPAPQYPLRDGSGAQFHLQKNPPQGRAWFYFRAGSSSVSTP